MGLSEHESEQQSIEMYCDEYKSSKDDGTDPGVFGVENFDNWLDSQGEGESGLAEDEFRRRVADVGFDPETLDWTN